jgi:nitronate monooxygenase
MGTAFLFCPESAVPPLHRAALKAAEADQTALTNVFTGRAARVLVNRFVQEVGPVAGDVPEFPTAIAHVSPLRERAEANGSTDFTALWAGQTTKLGRELSAADLIRILATEARDLFSRLGATN